MAKPLYLKPAEGRRVRREDGPLLDPDGELVSASPYWERRLADGDVEVTTKAKAAGPGNN